MLIKGLSYLQSSVQNTVIACPQNKSLRTGGWHGGKDSINNNVKYLKNQIHNLSSFQRGFFSGQGRFLRIRELG